MAISPNTTFTTGQVLTSANANAYPFGVVGNVIRTAGNLTLGTTAADLTGMSITFTAIANRLYRASWSVTGQNTTGTSSFAVVALNNGAGDLQWALETQSVNGYFTLSSSFVISGLTSGSKTMKLQGRSQFAGATLFAVPGGPLQFTIEDIGPT